MTFLERMWAYITLGAMGIVWEEASPLLGGVAAFDRNLDLVSVINAVALGTWIAGILLYFAGRVYGRWLRKSWRAARPMILRSVALVRRHPWRASLAVRFAYGLRIALPIACGVARLRLPIYLIGSAISCIVWSLVFTLIGWSLGNTTERLVGHVREYEWLVGLVFVAIMVLGFWVFRRRNQAGKTVRVLDRENRGTPVAP